jgi:hypothetical protein
MALRRIMLRVPLLRSRRHTNQFAISQGRRIAISRRSIASALLYGQNFGTHGNPLGKRDASSSRVLRLVAFMIGSALALFSRLPQSAFNTPPQVSGHPRQHSIHIGRRHGGSRRRE